MVELNPYIKQWVCIYNHISQKSVSCDYSSTHWFDWLETKCVAKEVPSSYILYRNISRLLASNFICYGSLSCSPAAYMNTSYPATNWAHAETKLYQITTTYRHISSIFTLQPKERKQTCTKIVLKYALFFHIRCIIWYQILYYSIYTRTFCSAYSFMQYIARIWPRYSLRGLHISIPLVFRQKPSDTALLSVIALTTFRCTVSASVTKGALVCFVVNVIDDVTEPIMTSQRFTMRCVIF